MKHNSLQKVMSILMISVLGFVGCAEKTPPVPNMKQPKFQVDKELYPFASHYITLQDGSKIHYVDEGEGNTTILLLHGNPTWSFLYRKMIPSLAKDFRVIAPDYPGFGLSYAAKDFDFKAASQAKEMNEFFDKLHLDNVIIMMQDWGGPIGFDIAIHHKRNIKGFVIGNTWAWPLERFGQKGFSTLYGGWYGQFISWSYDGIVSFFMAHGVEHELSNRELAMYHAPFQDPNNRKQTYIFPAELWDAKKFLSQVYQNLPSLSDKPVLLVWGEEDFAFQEPERTRFEHIFGNHTTVLLQDAGHFVQEDAPKEIVEAIQKWHFNK